MVVVVDVNPGAEVTAGGDIIVMGSLRGLAHAENCRSERAVVVAFNLKPTQIRIGSAIGRPPEGDVGSREGPEVARLKDGVIVIEPLDESRWEGDWWSGAIVITSGKGGVGKTTACANLGVALGIYGI